MRPVTEIRAQPAVRPRRASFNDRRALKMLPARIASLHTQITDLNAVLADPDLYARDPGQFGVTSKGHQEPIRGKPFRASMAMNYEPLHSMAMQRTSWQPPKSI